MASRGCCSGSRCTHTASTGRRFDCGNKLGYLQATVELSLAHPVLGEEFRSYLKRWRHSSAEPLRRPRDLGHTLRAP